MVERSVGLGSRREWFTRRVGVQGEVVGADLDGEHALLRGTALTGREDRAVGAHPALRVGSDDLISVCHGAALGIDLQVRVR